MQSKLATWSTENKERKFDRLLRLIADRDWLSEAARITLVSSGARTPGVDGVDKHMLEANLQHELATIREELLAGSYSPLPARRVYIPKANGKLRPLGIPSLRDRIVQRAMLMAMEPIWESDFHPASHGFRPARSVHHAIRTVKLQLQDGGEQSVAGRWVIEGDLASYFDTVHHRLLLKGIRKRIADQRFLALLWRFIKAGCVDRDLFRAASEGVPQGGVISPLLSNIMLHEFDAWMERNYLSKKVRKDRWAWNFAILKQRPIAVRENRQWKPAIAYCRYADDFVIVVKGTREHAEAVREACREFLEGELKLTLNMEKTHITHVNDGFVFLGHRIIRKRGPRGRMRPVTTIPWEKYRGFAERLVKQLSGNYGMNRMDLMEKPESADRWLGCLLPIHRLHGHHVQQTRSHDLLEIRTLARAKVSAQIHVADARLHPGTRAGTGNDMGAARPKQSRLVWGGGASASRYQSEGSIQVAYAVGKSVHHAR